MFFPNRPGFVEDITKHLGVFSWFTVPVAVHLQNTNAKIHKVVQRCYSSEVENVYDTLLQIYSGQYVGDMTKTFYVFFSVYIVYTASKMCEWCVF